MIKKYFLLALFVSCAAHKEGHVYVCKSNLGKKYHYTENCEGLSNCKHEVAHISKEEAQKLGYKICELEK